MATVVLGQDEDYDTLNNIQLGATQLQASGLSSFSFADSANGVEIFQSGDLLAVVSWQSVSTFKNARPQNRIAPI